VRTYEHTATAGGNVHSVADSRTPGSERPATGNDPGAPEHVQGIKPGSRYVLNIIVVYYAYNLSFYGLGSE
jgi:hypothetical protein